MKRLITILLAFLYITLTSGFTVNAHYCMGKLASLNLISHADDVCNKCSKPEKKKKGKCCKEEAKFCKADVSSHQLAKVQQSSEPAVKDLSLPVTILPVPAISSTQFIVPYSHGPPDDCKPVPLYIQYCTYLI
ncbi:HYC_CC_PP family protein [Chitinophaga rhizophila]|uniref:Uncharacterized protein n=1 Tax=Chitinophaga rhizophila TaxID=2866212 RepID=A0ABS7GDC8_9BACT|nr:hypothetical protein [Chitinophaga rhizophila]MBW8685160.1 hypothetical protein [Chitinophaga rhizophila]